MSNRKRQRNEKSVLEVVTKGELRPLPPKKIAPLAAQPLAAVEFTRSELVYLWELLAVDRVAVQPLLKLMIGNIEEAMDSRLLAAEAMKPRIKSALLKLQRAVTQEKE